MKDQQVHEKCSSSLVVQEIQIKATERLLLDHERPGILALRRRMQSRARDEA